MPLIAPKDLLEHRYILGVYQDPDLKETWDKAMQSGEKKNVQFIHSGRLLRQITEIFGESAGSSYLNLPVLNLLDSIFQSLDSVF